MSDDVTPLLRNFRGRTATLKENHDPVHATSSLVAPTLIPFAINGAGYFDDANTMSVFVYLPSRMYALTEARVMLNFREFFAPATTIASGGGSTSGSGGSSTPTSSSGGSATPTSDSSTSSDHQHRWALWQNNAPGAHTNRLYADQQGTAIVLETDAGNDLYTTNNGAYSHTHAVTIAGHTHTVTIAAHTHTTPDHTHSISYGVYKEAYPASHSVDLKLYQYSAGWNLIHTFSALTTDQPEVDMTDYLTSTGKWRIDLISEAAQPNSGRLGCDVSGFVLGAVQGA